MSAVGTEERASIGQRVGDATFVPVRNVAEQTGNIFLLTSKTIRSAFKPPFDYVPELASQFLFALRLGWFPMILTSIGLCFGPAGIQIAGILKVLGAIDRLGGVFVLVVIREVGPLVCGIVMAGVAGTAITADLGARKVREELDALMVLGVDPIKYIVVPRFVALAFITSLFDIFALISGTAGGVLVAIVNHAPVGGFFATYFTAATPLELGASLIKTFLFGGMIAVICCYKGLTASGGAQGVGKAVNEAVVMAMLSIGALDYVFTQTLLATNPSLSAIR